MEPASNDPPSELKRETILGIDNIPLELPIAGIGSRALAVALDYMLLGIVMIFAVVIVFVALPDDSFGLAAALGSLVLFLLQWGYFAAFEVALGGRTPGKAAVGLRVVDRRGGAARPMSLVVRNLVRGIDVIVGAPMIAFDPLARRLGDWLGSTLVVHNRKRPETILGRVPEGWGGDEVALTERLVSRLDELEPARAAELSRRLLAIVAHDEPEVVAGHEGYVRLDPADALRRLLRASDPGRPGPAAPRRPPREDG